MVCACVIANRSAYPVADKQGENCFPVTMTAAYIGSSLNAKVI
jgi:hypothetical protein